MAKDKESPNATKKATQTRHALHFLTSFLTIFSQTAAVRANHSHFTLSTNYRYHFAGIISVSRPSTSVDGSYESHNRVINSSLSSS